MIARISLVLILCVAAIAGNAQEKMYIFKDGLIQSEKKISDIDSIVFIQPNNEPLLTYNDVYVVGDFNQWDLEGATKMTKQSNRVFEFTYSYTAEASLLFIGDDFEWTNGFGVKNNYVVGEGEYVLYSDGHLALRIQKGNWHLVVDLEKNTLIVTELEDTNIYVVGDATPGGWDPRMSTPLVKDIESGINEGTVDFITSQDGMQYTFRFLGQNIDWGPVSWFYDDCYSVESIPSGLVEAAPANEYGEINFRVTEEGEYKVEASMHTSGKLMLVFTKL